MDMIIPGIPHKYPQNINITRIAITFMENVFPMKIGSKIAPNNISIPPTTAKKKNRVVGASISTKANSVMAITAITEPIICTKLIAKANTPQKIGKLTSKYIQAIVNPIPVNKLITNFTTTNLKMSFSILINVLTEAKFCLNRKSFNARCTLIDPAKSNTTKSENK